MDGLKHNLQSIRRTLAQERITVEDIEMLLKYCLRKEGEYIGDGSGCGALESRLQQIEAADYQECYEILSQFVAKEKDSCGSFQEYLDNGSVEQVLKREEALMWQMMTAHDQKHKKRFRPEDIEKAGTGHMYGRILSYRPANGYGYIRAENGKDIFLSSYVLGRKKMEKWLRTGAVVTFCPEITERGIQAKNITIIDPHPVASLMLPNGLTVDPWHIDKIINVSGISAVNYQLRRGASYREIYGTIREDNDLAHIFVEMRRGKEYRFYGLESCIVGDGQTDLKKYYDYINRELFMV